MNFKLKIAGINLTISGTLLLVSHIITSLSVLYNWHPENIILATEISLVLFIVGFIILITVGSNLIKASE